MEQMNFGRNVKLTPRFHYTPVTEKEVLEILDRHRGQRIRCVGRLHSWSRILDSDDVLLDLRNLNSVQIESESGEFSAQVGAGCQIKRLLIELKSNQGLTLPSVGFITEQTIAGAISTGTHGSGRNSLSHYVRKVRIATYDPTTGEAIIREITKGDELRAARCSLGCLGVILSVTMECRPSYQIEEGFDEFPDIESVLNSEDAFPLQQFYFVPWRWTYFSQQRRESSKSTSVGFHFYKWHRFVTIDIFMHLLMLFCVKIMRLRFFVHAIFRWIVPFFVIKKWRVVGPANKQLVMEHELFRHVEIELFVQRQNLADAMEFLKSALVAADNRNAPVNAKFTSQVSELNCVKDFESVQGTYCHHFPICVRKVLPDETLISMASNAGFPAQSLEVTSAWYSITLTNYHRGKRFEQFRTFAGFLATTMTQLFSARLHWGKICPIHLSQLGDQYPALDQFREICLRLDPDGRFGNAWTDKLLKNDES